MRVYIIDHCVYTFLLTQTLCVPLSLSPSLPPPPTLFLSLSLPFCLSLSVSLSVCLSVSLSLSLSLSLCFRVYVCVLKTTHSLRTVLSWTRLLGGVTRHHVAAGHAVQWRLVLVAAGVSGVVGARSWSLL